MARQSRPLAAHWSDTPLVNVLGPMRQFVSSSAAGGIVLIIATIIALVIANSPLAGRYAALLELPLGISVGPWVLEESLLHWINDGLMAIFFFLVGLEIKREVSAGELSSPRAATLPIVAALGGAIVPALIYLLLNAGGAAASGWGIPMATDIAFALGCLALLGDRVPFGLTIFLTAVAIVDDLIAVLVIALFYSGALNLTALGIGFAVLALLLAANWFGIRSVLIYSTLGLIVWLAFLKSGVHATIAGVLIAFTVPARYRIDAPTFVRRAERLVQRFEQRALELTPMLINETQQSSVLKLEDLCEQVQAPLQKMEHALQPWVAFVSLPIFALANANVTIGLGGLSGATLPLTLGIVLGLTLGKPLGLLATTWLALRLGLTELPQGVTWRHMLGVGVLAGIGFTMSLFIASLGFRDPALLATAKLAILIASLIAGTVGLLLLARLGAAAPDAR